MVKPMPRSVLPLSQFPRDSVLDFFRAGHLSFQHLDWLSPVERVNQPFGSALVNNSEILAALSTAPEQLLVSWIRFFISLRDGLHAAYFHALLEASLEALHDGGFSKLYALGSQAWMNRLLEENRFTTTEQVVTLQIQPHLARQNRIPAGIGILPIQEADLPAILKIDRSAFPTEWQMDAVSLQKCWALSPFASKAIVDGRILGYLLTTSTLGSAHLARFAVSPESQNRGIGTALLQELMQSCQTAGIVDLTVNTQKSNSHSIHVYEKAGFSLQPGELPVYCLPF